MSRNVTRLNTAKRKQVEAKEQDEAAEEIQDEIATLTQTQKETSERLKTLKASRGDLRKRGQKFSSKAESNSSGRVRSSTKGKKAESVAAAAKQGPKKRAFCCFILSYVSLSMISPGDARARRMSSALTGSSLNNQHCTAGAPQSEPMNVDDFGVSGNAMEDVIGGNLKSEYSVSRSPYMTLLRTYSEHPCIQHGEHHCVRLSEHHRIRQPPQHRPRGGNLCR